MGNGTLGHWIDPLKDYQASPGILTTALSEISQGAAKGDGGRSSSSNINVTTLLFLHNSLRPGEPGIIYTLQTFPQKRLLPTCLPFVSFPPQMTQCQSPFSRDRSIIPGFSFSPPVGHYKFN